MTRTIQRLACIQVKITTILHVRAEKHYIRVNDNRARLLVHDPTPYIFHLADIVQLNTLVSPSLSTIPSRFVLRSGYYRRLVFHDIPT